MRTDYYQMAGPGAGRVVDGAPDCPCATLLDKTPNLVCTQVGDEHLVGVLDDLGGRSQSGRRGRRIRFRLT
jgi:hypothetical protein